MHYDLLTLLETCGLSFVVIWVIGLPMLLVGAKKARAEFRVKGYLRPPSGTKWFPFLLWKHYEAFDSPGTQFFFSIARGCLIAMLIVLSAAAALIGCVLLLRGVSDTPWNGITSLNGPVLHR